MNVEKLNLLASHLGILGGLILATFQIQQESVIAKAQLFSDITTSRMEMAGVTLGENPAPIVAKSLSCLLEGVQASGVLACTGPQASNREITASSRSACEKFSNSQDDLEKIGPAPRQGTGPTPYVFRRH